MFSALLLATQITTAASSDEVTASGSQLTRDVVHEAEPAAVATDVSDDSVPRAAAVPRAASEVREPTRFSLRLQHGGGAAGDELIGNVAASAHWWFEEQVAVGLRYNLVGSVWTYNEERTVQSGTVALSWRSAAAGSHAFASTWGGMGQWKQTDLFTEESTSGSGVHLGAEAGWLWRFGFVEVGPALRGEIFEFERDFRQAVSFNFVAGLSL